MTERNTTPIGSGCSLPGWNGILKKNGTEDRVRTQPCEAETQTDAETSALSEENWQFGDRFEMLLYLMKLREQGFTGTVRCLDSREYHALIAEGIRLLAEHYPLGAYRVFKIAMRKNPVAVTARFGAVECLIKLGQNEAAKKLLLEDPDCFREASDAARFYRRLGYLAAEDGDYEFALALQFASCLYGFSEETDTEVRYILSVKGPDFDVEDPARILSEHRIPRIEAVRIADRDRIPDAVTLL